MEAQNFKRHAQFVPGFHFLTTAVIIAALVIAIILSVRNGVGLEAIFNFLIVLSIGLLFNFTRQFAVKNQDRIIRAEENLRSFRLSGKILDHRLTRRQIIALRFADDEEYAELSEKAVNEKLHPKAIKAAIHKWRADHHRV